ncbi:MAG: ATP-binding protein [Patescibacteria group bacterium]|nr:ATP-binding protein [Patescibacteria group bacterium]
MTTNLSSIKIAIIAAHSTGKTTLAKALSKKLKISHIKSDFAREITKEKFNGKKLQELTKKEFFNMELSHYLKKLEVAVRNEAFVTDGGFILSPIYLGLMNPELLEEEKYIKFLDLCVKRTKNIYTHIIYLPPEIELEDDNYRPMDEDLRVKVDELLINLLRYHDIKYREVSGSVLDRVSQAINYLKNSLNTRPGLF